MSKNRKFLEGNHNVLLDLRNEISHERRKKKNFDLQEEKNNSSDRVKDKNKKTAALCKG